MRRCAVVLVVAAALAGAAPPAAAEGAAVSYRPPVDGPVVDRFRPPATPYGAGNLGVDYATAPGTPVRAAAGGEVVFAGPVGGTLHVVVLHADGVRTSYSFLAAVAVARGQLVGPGAPIATAGVGVHFGARVGDAYLDPVVLLAAGPPRVRLVPDALRRPAPEADERSHLRRFLGVVGDAAAATAATAAAAAGTTAELGADAVGWARDGVVLAGHLAVAAGEVAVAKLAADVAETLEQWRLMVHYAGILATPYWVEEALVRAQAKREWRRDQRGCTPEGAPAPELSDRHLVVLVAGLGSEQRPDLSRPDEGGAVFAVDTGDIGYREEDTFRFSYRGGTADQRSYTAADTQVDIRESGRRLRTLLEDLQHRYPGVTIDLIAHSQGGLVVRSALGDDLDRFDPRTPPIGTVVTLATPHHGANLATAGALIGHTNAGQVLQVAAGELEVSSIDPRSPSVQQMAETSEFIRDLNDDPLPDGVRFVSIAARGDLVVPSPRSHLDGATNVIVDAGGGVRDHDQLPRSPAAQREVALAVNGRRPGCESWEDAEKDALEGLWISRTEDTMAAASGLLLGRLAGW